jgi:foldase protein PrsA
MAALARRYSLRKETAQKGGEMGYFGRGSHGIIGQTAFRLKLREFSNPLEVEKNLYSIFKVIGHEGKEPDDFARVEEKVKADLLKEKKAAEYLAFLQEIRKKTKISVDEEVLKKTAATLDFKHRIDFVQTRRFRQ